jgi:hypothetical protein
MDESGNPRWTFSRSLQTRKRVHLGLTLPMLHFGVKIDSRRMRIETTRTCCWGKNAPLVHLACFGFFLELGVENVLV